MLAATVMAFTSLQFLITADYELTAQPGWKAASGIAGLVLAGVALYAGLALELDVSDDPGTLGVGRRSRRLPDRNGRRERKMASGHEAAD